MVLFLLIQHATDGSHSTYKQIRHLLNRTSTYPTIPLPLPPLVQYLVFVPSKLDRVFPVVNLSISF